MRSKFIVAPSKAKGGHCVFSQVFLPADKAQPYYLVYHSGPFKIIAEAYRECRKLNKTESKL